jgi:hypothetical protein
MAAINVDQDIEDVIQQLNEQLQVSDTTFDGAYVSYGYIGDMPTETMFVKRYEIMDEFCDKYEELDEDGCIPGWGKYMLNLKLFATGDEYVVDYYDQRMLIKVGCLITAMKNNGQVVERVVYDEHLRGAMYFNEEFKILKCVSFENYIRAANKIKRAWRSYKKLQLEIAAATKIQRAVMHYLYRPEGRIVKQLESNFNAWVAAH